MSGCDTKNLILDTAIVLFNEYTSSAISSNRVADESNMSRGNLHYHFRTKQDIIRAIFQRFEKEMLKVWCRPPTITPRANMDRVFVGQVRVLWRYRFLHMEISTLLRKDRYLFERFLIHQNNQFKKTRLLFLMMIDAGVLVEPKLPVTVASLTKIFQLLIEDHISQLSIFDKSPTKSTVKEGLVLIDQIFAPHFTKKRGTKEEKRRRNYYGLGHVARQREQKYWRQK